MAAARRPYASVHDAYVAEGPADFYRRHGGDYRNPHEPVLAELIGLCVRDWPLDLTHVLDLAAGSGEVTLALRDPPTVARASRPCLPGEDHGRDARATVATISAIDPFTAAAYERRTGLPCETLTFEQTATGAVRGRSYSLIVCSFALHLAVPSRLPTLCWELAAVATQLLVLTPHKRPTIDPAWGWTMTHERLHRRVRARLYVSQAAQKALF